MIFNVSHGRAEALPNRRNKMRVFRNMKGYKTLENAIKAVEKKAPGLLDTIRWVPVVVTDGRIAIALIGRENLDNWHNLGNVGILD